MIRKLGVIGLALCAALALGVGFASTASATGKYEAFEYPDTATGDLEMLTNDTLITEGGKVECKYQHFEGTLSSGAQSTFTAKAKYLECKAFGFATATFAMRSCDYLFNTPTGSGLNWSATVSIKCTKATEPIQVAAGTCKITIGEQTPGGSVSLTDNTIFGMVTMKANLTGIKYTVTEDGFGCPFNGTGSKTGASYVQDGGIDLFSASGGYFRIS